MVEGKIEMAARRQVTNKLRTVYARASKRDKARILDEVMSTTGMGRSTARRMLTGQALPDPAEQVDKRKLRPKEYSDDSRSLLEHVWALMGCPCGKYLVVMRGLWLPLLAEAGDLDKPFATAEAIAELQAMSAATIDRYLAPARKSMQLRGISTTKPSPLLRNSIGLSKVGDVMVDELRSVVRVEHEKRKREHALQGGDGLDDPLRRVVADRRVLGPPGDQVGHRQSPRELALERRPAVRDGVRLDHPRRRGRFVADLAQPDRVTQQRRRTGHDAGGDRGGHRRALRADVPGRVHADSDDDRPGHRVDRERVDPQQRVSMDRQGRRRPAGHVPVSASRVRLGQRIGVH